MIDNTIGLAPTSTATTPATEPDVFAGIASGNPPPRQTLTIRTEHGGGWGRTLACLTAGIVAGTAIALLTRRAY